MKHILVLAMTMAVAPWSTAQTDNSAHLEKALQALKSEKTKVFKSLDRIASFHPLHVSYPTHAIEWMEVKDGINRTSKIVRNLDAHRASMSAAQVARLEDFKAQLAELASSTQRMITELREDSRLVGRPSYMSATKELAAKASSARGKAIEILASDSRPRTSQSGD